MFLCVPCAFFLKDSGLVWGFFVDGWFCGPTLVTTFQGLKGFYCHCTGHISAAASALWDKPVPGDVGWYLLEHHAEVKSCGPADGSALTASGTILRSNVVNPAAVHLKPPTLSSPPLLIDNKLAYFNQKILDV